MIDIEQCREIFGRGQQSGASSLILDALDELEQLRAELEQCRLGAANREMEVRELRAAHQELTEAAKVLNDNPEEATGEMWETLDTVLAKQEGGK